MKNHKNVALSKAEFASNVLARNGSFADFNCDAFRAIFNIAEAILQSAGGKTDLALGGLDGFQKILEGLDKQHHFEMVVDAAIRAGKLLPMTFAAATIRFYESLSNKDAVEIQKRLRPIRQVLTTSFTNPSLTTLLKLAKQCYHLVDDQAPMPLRNLRAVMAENPVLGLLGDLLDDLERVFPPDLGRGRIVNKPQLKKPVLEYVLPELAKYEARIKELTETTSSTNVLETAEADRWSGALSMLLDIFKPLQSLVFRVDRIERVRNDSDQFDVRSTTYRDGQAFSQVVTREYKDLTSDQLETYELLFETGEGTDSINLAPFLCIRGNRLHYYNRTRALGYEYRPLFGDSQLVPTKRKFSHVALGTIGSDLQMLFWAEVVPSVGAAGVKANIPTQDPNAFVGRNEQIKQISEEIIQIVNRDGLIWGLGGVGKTCVANRVV